MCIQILSLYLQLSISSYCNSLYLLSGSLSVYQALIVAYVSYRHSIAVVMQVASGVGAGQVSIRFSCADCTNATDAPAYLLIRQTTQLEKLPVGKGELLFW